MSYKVESVNSCTKKIIFTFDQLDLTSQVKEAVKRKQKTVNIKGFRKGKAPLAMVEQVYGQQIEMDALNDFVLGELNTAVKEETLQVVGRPNLENLNYDPSKSVSFDAIVEIFPSVEVTDLTKLSFSKDKVEVTDEEIDKTEKSYLNSKATMVAIEDKSVEIKDGHHVVFNFEGVKENGERPENMKGKEFLLEIGSNQFIPGFEEGMKGLKAGDKKNIDLSFPTDYHAEDLQDSKVTFEVDVLEIKEKQYPEMTDELAKEFGADTPVALRAKIKEDLLSQKNREVQEKLNQEMINKIIEKSPFDVPDTLVKMQENYIREDITKSLQQQGFNEQMTAEYFEKWAKDVTAKAVYQVKSGVILDKLAKEYSVEAGDADLDAKIEEMSTKSGLDIEQVKQYYLKDEKVKNNMLYAIREEKTFAKLMEQVKIS